jgi:hypothetical protein
MRRVRGAAWLVGAALALGAAPAAPAAGDIEIVDGLKVVHLSGTPYEIGRRHGELLRVEVRAAIDQLLGYFRRYVKIPGVRSFAVNWWLDSAWRKAQPHIPPDYLEELRGLAHGSGVSRADLYRLHSIPDRTYSCANFAAWGSQTADGRMIHMRNLDWNIRAGLQDFAVVFVVRPKGKQAFVSAAWAGFIGVLSGVNESQVSIGQIGAETTDVHFAGEPMVFLMRRTMEEARDLDQAAGIIRDARRTVGVNYVVADAKIPRGTALETTRHHYRRFDDDDPTERMVDYARPLKDAVCRADTAIDPVIRERQLASRGNPGRPGLEPPEGSAYTVRYLGQAKGLEERRGRLNVESAKDIARAVAPDSNIQSVIVAWPEAWVANADGMTRAAHTPYHRLDLEALLAVPATEPGATPR